MSNQQDAREQARHRIAVMQAWVDGKEIEFTDKNHIEWKSIEFPVWNWNASQYRVKPEERKPMTGAMWKHPNSIHLCTHHGCSSDDVAELNGWSFVIVAEVLPETETES